MATIRRPGAASAAVLVGLTVCLAGTYAVAPEWSRRAGLDVWNYAAIDAERREIVEERADMDAKAERDVRRRARADQLAARLVTQEAALATVAGELLELFADAPGTLTALASINPGVNDPQLLYAKHAILRVGRLISDPVQRKAVRTRLEADYQALAAAQTSAR